MKNIKSLSISTILTIILITFLTIYAELNPIFKEFLKSLTSHHWISKGVISLVFFILAYFILDKIISKEKNVNSYINLVLAFVILGSLAIFGFYLYEFFIVP